MEGHLRLRKKGLSFRNRILSLGILLTAAPLLLFGCIVWWQDRQLQNTALTGCAKSAEADLDHIAAGVYRLCQESRNSLEHNVLENLHSAKQLLELGGAVTTQPRSQVTWSARNQFTNAVAGISLPKLLVGGRWLGQTEAVNSRAPIVDEVRELTNATSTIFQRMNPEGDMLRVATNVIGSGGKRAIGTYIPAVGPDGKANPVVQTVLGGKTFVGRAYVVNAWYMAAYEPLFDANHAVIGMLYVGVPEAYVEKPLRQSIMSTTVGKTGYVYVLHATGPERGHYVVSKGGQRDGEDIWDSRDGKGNPFIQEICKRAVLLKPNEMSTFRYPWRNGSDTQMVNKIARIVYFKPWDWVIGVSVPEADMYETAIAVNNISRRGSLILLAMGLVTLAISCITWYFLANKLTRRTDKIIRKLSTASTEMSSAAGMVSETSQKLALDAEAQAGSNERISASLSEMKQMAAQSLAHCRALKGLAAQTRSAVEGGAAQICEMTETTKRIQSAGAEVVKINKMIDQIAFQTNILALNAAVEAARAGETGLGFAVVADEVRALAQRSAEAARETSDRIKNSMIAGEEAVSITKELSERLEAITANTRKLDELAQSVAVASEQQELGITDINTAASAMHRSIRSTAQNAQDGAIRANQYTSHARALDSLAGELSEMFQRSA